MNDVQHRVRSIVADWPGDGYVVGVLPDPSDPEWSGRAVLELIEAADRGGGPGVVVDLAPETTDLASRFEAVGGPGLAELADGEVELWEISHRSDVHRAIYVPAGSGRTGSDLAGSETTAELVEKMKDAGRLLLLVLDRAGAEAADASGRLDGLVRIGDGADEYEGVPELGHLPGRPGASGPVPETRSGPRLVLPPEMRSDRRRKRRIRRWLIALVVLIALALVASSLLGGPDVRDLFFDPNGASAAAARMDDRQPQPAGSDSVPELSAPLAEPISELATDVETSDSTTVDTAATPGAGEDTSSVEARDGGEERPAGASPPTIPALPESAGPPEFRAVADSLAVSIRDFSLQAERFRAGVVGCGALIEARRRVDQLFERLWLQRMSLQPGPDSPAAATFRERARQMETVASAYEATSCPAEAFEGS